MLHASQGSQRDFSSLGLGHVTRKIAGNSTKARLITTRSHEETGGSNMLLLQTRIGFEPTSSTTQSCPQTPMLTTRPITELKSHETTESTRFSTMERERRVRRSNDQSERLYHAKEAPRN